MFSFVSILESKNTAIRTIIVAARYQKKKDHEARSINPVATPRGIPSIRPNPSINDGAIATSGLFAREKRTIKRSSPKNNSGFIIRPVNNNGMPYRCSPGVLTIMVILTDSRTIKTEAICTD